MSEPRAAYDQVKVKCLRCGLHFIVCTWDASRHTRRTLCCPECHQRDAAFAVWRESVAGFIYQAVPGDAKLVDFGLGQDAGP